jgi:hypothetical protein
LFLVYAFLIYKANAKINKEKEKGNKILDKENLA